MGRGGEFTNRVAEEIHHLGDLFLGLVRARHVAEGDLDLVFRQHPRPALAEGHGAPSAGAALHLAHEKNPQADENEKGEPVDQDLHQDRRFLRRSGIDHDVVVE